MKIDQNNSLTINNLLSFFNDLGITIFLFTSEMNKIISDFDAFSSVFFMPSFSILSLVFRMLTEAAHLCRPVANV